MLQFTLYGDSTANFRMQFQEVDNVLDNVTSFAALKEVVVDISVPELDRLAEMKADGRSEYYWGFMKEHVDKRRHELERVKAGIQEMFPRMVRRSLFRFGNA